MIDDAQLRALLLGGNREDLENRLSSDPGLVARLEVLESRLVDDYVLGALTADENRAFESCYLITPDRREKVAFARSIFQAARRGRWSKIALGAAAVVVILAVGLWERARVADQSSATLILSATAHRGAAAPAFSLSTGKEFVRLEIHLSTTANGPLTVRVQGIGLPDPLLQLRLPRATSPMIAIPLPASTLDPGDYIVTVSSAPDLQLEFVFQVVP